MEYKFIKITYKIQIRTVSNVYPYFCLIPCSFHDFQHFILILFCFDGWYRGVDWLTWIAYSNLRLGYLIVLEQNPSLFQSNRVIIWTCLTERYRIFSRHSFGQSVVTESDVMLHVAGEGMTNFVVVFNANYLMVLSVNLNVGYTLPIGYLHLLQPFYLQHCDWLCPSMAYPSTLHQPIQFG